jgi:hypothetical protein
MYLLPTFYASIVLEVHIPEHTVRIIYVCVLKKGEGQEGGSY